MKKSLLLIIVIFAWTANYAQEKNGTLYSQHPAIETTKKLWSAFEKGDKAAFGAFLSDSMVAIYNGDENFQKRADYLNSIDWWKSEFENLKVVDDTPAFPDALDYTKGGLWVQDWLLITGTHKKSGINLYLHLHNLYSFNKDGKITALFLYFDNTQFEEIRASRTTEENGKLYINHPYIITVRKAVNAYCAMDLAATADFFSPKASFSNSAMKMGESKDLTARKKEWAEDFAGSDNIKMKQVGYPDCLYYAKNDSYTVYSWWAWSGTLKKDGTKVEFPLMLAHTFDKDGKIVSEEAYFSDNHLK